MAANQVLTQSDLTPGTMLVHSLTGRKCIAVSGIVPIRITWGSERYDGVRVRASGSYMYYNGNDYFSVEGLHDESLTLNEIEVDHGSTYRPLMPTDLTPGAILNHRLVGSKCMVLRANGPEKIYVRIDGPYRVACDGCYSYKTATGLHDESVTVYELEKAPDRSAFRS